MKIEKMNSEDLEKVTQLAGQLGYPNRTQSVGKRFERIFNNPDFGLFVAKSDDGEVRGWIQINAEPVTLLTDQKAEIVALVVDDQVRSQGVGKKLVARAEQWASEAGIDMIRVRSNVTRMDAHRFYQREGYALSKTGNIFVKELKLSGVDHLCSN